ncbi:phage tail assembly chaperone [Heyndrickxia sporothermodurans]
MSELQAFFAENVEEQQIKEEVISKRFKDKQGHPIKWKIKAIDEELNSELRKKATKRIKIKTGVYMPETDNEKYVSTLIEACVVFPDLKDAGLQKSYGVMGADQLIKKMLLPGEYSYLAQQVQEINKFDIDINETVDEIKN